MQYNGRRENRASSTRTLANEKHKNKTRPKKTCG